MGPMAQQPRQLTVCNVNLKSEVVSPGLILRYVEIASTILAPFLT